MRNQVLKLSPNKILLAMFLGAALIISPNYASANLPAGSGSFVFDENAGNRDLPITVWYYYPAGATASTPILFTMHGYERNAKHMRNVWVPYAKVSNFIVIAPEFTKESYPYYDRGNHYGPGSDPRSTFADVESLFDYVKIITGNTSGQYYIYGHSAGGQFVHRLVVLYPTARIKLAIAANAGWYTMPDFSVKFPYGLKNTAVTTADLELSFSKRLIILLGENDTDENHPELNRSPGAEKQGTQRFARGHTFYAAAQAKAAAISSNLNWTLQTVPDVAHDNPKMAKAAAAILAQYLESMKGSTNF